jgi:hypothetical protein
VRGSYRVYYKLIVRKLDRHTRVGREISLGASLAYLTYTTIESFRATPMHTLEMSKVLSAVLAIEVSQVKITTAGSVWDLEWPPADGRDSLCQPDVFLGQDDLPGPILLVVNQLKGRHSSKTIKKMGKLDFPIFPGISTSR